MTAATNDSTDLRAALEAELGRLRSTDIGRRMTAIEVLLGEDGAMAVPRLEDRTATRPAPGRRGPGVSQTKLAAVRQYLQAHEEVRQVDIAKDLEENTGSVSLALRALADEGVAQDTGAVDNKSKVWRWIGEPAEPGRATVIEPGTGIREGRRR
jgi:hypothetical protein